MSHEGNNLWYWKLPEFNIYTSVEYVFSSEKPPDTIFHTLVKACPEKNEVTADSNNVSRVN